MMAATVQEFIREYEDSLSFRVVAGSSGLSNPIAAPELHRPTMALLGHVLALHDHEMQILGETEILFLRSLDDAAQRESVRHLFSFPFPCLIITANLDPPETLTEVAEQKSVPCLLTAVSTIETTRIVAAFLDRLLSERKILQGTLVDIGGLGTLLLGEPGVGKSEAALELLARGHRIVADDVVEVRRSPEGRLIGRATPLIGHHMEIRGVGIVDLGRLFGARAVRHEISLQLVIELVHSDKVHGLDRIGLDEEHFEFMGSRVPRKIIPVRPGRNMAVVIEVTCLDERLRQLGIHAAREFDQRVKTEIIRKEGILHGR